MKDPTADPHSPALNPYRGENSPVAKLTEEQVKEIIQRNIAGERHGSLAKEFGVTIGCIGLLVRGKRWTAVPGSRRNRSMREGTGNHLAKLTDDHVREIRAAHAAGVSYRRLAAQYGVTVSPIFAIVKGRSWKHVQ